jgi:hypothetical protein
MFGRIATPLHAAAAASAGTPRGARRRQRPRLPSLAIWPPAPFGPVIRSFPRADPQADGKSPCSYLNVVARAGRQTETNVPTFPYQKVRLIRPRLTTARRRREPLFRPQGMPGTRTDPRLRGFFHRHRPPSGGGADGSPAGSGVVMVSASFQHVQPAAQYLPADERLRVGGACQCRNPAGCHGAGGPAASLARSEWKAS